MPPLPPPPPPCVHGRARPSSPRPRRRRPARRQEHHRERKGLLEAFALLNPSKTGYVDVRTWARLMLQLSPAMTDTEAVLRFHMVAHQAPSRGVHVLEFLRLHSNLSVTLVEESANAGRPRLRPLPDSLRLALLIGNAVIFGAYSPLQSSYAHRALFAAHTALLPMLLLDRKSWTPSRRGLNGGCLGVAVACAGGYWLCDLYLGLSPPAITQIGGQVALFLLLVQGSRVLRLIWRLLSYVLPQFLAVSVSVFMIVYVFSLLGMQLFHELPLTSGDTRYAHETLAGCENPFSSLPCTLFILFQVRRGPTGTGDPNPSAAPAPTSAPTPAHPPPHPAPPPPPHAPPHPSR